MHRFFAGAGELRRIDGFVLLLLGTGQGSPIERTAPQDNFGAHAALGVDVDRPLLEACMGTLTGRSKVRGSLLGPQVRAGN